MNTSRSIVEVGVAMVLKDRFSQEAGKISGSFRTMMNDMNTWNRGIQMSASNTMDFGMQLVGGMARAYKYSAGVQNEVWTASKIAGATIAEQREMLQLAKDVNEITPLTASDVASGQRYLAMAGNKFDAIKEMIGPASKLASIFTMPVGQKGGVADLITNIMSMYQIPMGEAARVTDDLYTAVTNANISLTDLAQSISYAGADMATAGVDLRQTAAAIGVLGDMGIQGSMAGTSLANMIRYLQLSLVNQKKKGYNALADLGLSPDEFFDAQGNLIDLYTIYQKFAKAAVDLPSRIETPTFFNIFGVRGNRGMLPVLRDIASGPLAQETWDYVVLQEMSHGPLTSPRSFFNSVRLLCQQIRQNGGVPLLYATWAYQKGGDTLTAKGWDYDEMARKLSQAYHRAARENGALLADVGHRFYLLSETQSLYAADGVHPNETGSRIAAETIAAVIRRHEAGGRSPEPG